MCNQDVVGIISCLVGSDTSKHHCEAAVRQSVARLTQYGMMTIDAPVAQWIEHLTSDQGVASSSLAWCAFLSRLSWTAFFMGLGALRDYLTFD